MSIQDIIFSVGSVIFILALIPSIRSAAKPALASSLMTGSILAVFAITYLTFSHPLYFAAATTAGTALCWYILAWQKWHSKADINFVTIDYEDENTRSKFYSEIQHESSV